MRTFRSILWLLASLALALPGAGPARAGEGKHERPPLDALLERHAERLGLDAATLDKIRAIGAASRPEHELLANEVHKLRLEMRELLGEDAPERDTVMALADRIGAAETLLDKHRLGTLLEIRALLTPAQRQELVQIFDERRRARHAAKRKAEESLAP
jgi:Spy/CpxP family protein refolding chaperone